jgi:hypothetical protein
LGAVFGGDGYVPTGASLFDGAWHTVVFEYAGTAIRLSFDGKLLSEITDASKIPIVPMKIIPGARVIVGNMQSPFRMEVDSLAFSDGGTVGLRRARIRAGSETRNARNRVTYIANGASIAVGALPEWNPATPAFTR